MLTNSKRYRRNVTREYDLGGFLKDIAPTAISAGVSFIPGVGPALAPLAGSLTSAALSEQSPEMNRPHNQITRGYASLGYRGGGTLKKTNKMNKKAYDSQYQWGGVTPLGNGAVRYDGPSHEQGGIPINQQGTPTEDNPIAEVEGGETRQDDYIFSDTLEVPEMGMTFAEAHELLIKEGASKEEIEELKAMQEKVKAQKGIQDGDMAPKTDGEQAAKAERIAQQGVNTGEPVAMPHGGKLSGPEFSEKHTVPGTNITFADYYQKLVDQGVGVRALKRLQQVQQRVMGDMSSRTSQAPAAEPVTTRERRAAEPVRTSERSYVYGGDLDYVYGGDLEYVYGGGLDWHKKDGGKIKTKTTSQKQKYNKELEKNFRERMKKMRQGDYSMVGETIDPDAKKKKQLGGEIEERDISGMTANVPVGSINPMAGSNSGGFNLDKAMNIAGYIVPSALRAGLALTDKGVKETPKLKGRRVPVRSTAFRGAERDLAGAYRSVLADPNATQTQKLAAYTQYLKGRSDLAGSEANYRSKQERFNVGQQTRADLTNIQSFQRDREIKAKEEGARKKLLTEAIEMPITRYRADRLGERSTIANIVTSAQNNIPNPTDRAKSIRTSLRAIGLDEQRISEILRQYNLN